MPEKLTTERLREIAAEDEPLMQSVTVHMRWRERIGMAKQLLALRAHGEAAPVMSCPHCGDPFAWVTEPEPDFHAGATYTCNKCGGAVIATFQTPEQYAAPPPEARPHWTDCKSKRGGECDCGLLVPLAPPPEAPPLSGAEAPTESESDDTPGLSAATIAATAELNWPAPLTPAQQVALCQEVQRHRAPKRLKLTPRRLEDAAQLMERIRAARDLGESDAMVVQAVAHWVMVQEEQRAQRGGEGGGITSEQASRPYRKALKKLRGGEVE